MLTPSHALSLNYNLSPERRVWSRNLAPYAFAVKTMLSRIRALSSLFFVSAALLVGSNALLAEEPADQGLITIESDQQAADSVTGVITASGNVRLVHDQRGVVATSRQAQYFTKESRIVLSGDVDVVQTDGNLLKADRVTYLLDEERAIATPLEGEQVFSSWTLKSSEPEPEPLRP
ncbi:MAG: hypothetical protein VX105_01810 [Cyanobacteriota bacterium]|nr:hypothetical protein [Cyanobacteriota bacterium]